MCPHSLGVAASCGLRQQTSRAVQLKNSILFPAHRDLGEPQQVVFRSRRIEGRTAIENVHGRYMIFDFCVLNHHSRPIDDPMAAAIWRRLCSVGHPRCVGDPPPPRRGHRAIPGKLPLCGKCHLLDGYSAPVPIRPLMIGHFTNRERTVLEAFRRYAITQVAAAAPVAVSYGTAKAIDLAGAIYGGTHMSIAVGERRMARPAWQVMWSRRRAATHRLASQTAYRVPPHFGPS